MKDAQSKENIVNINKLFMLAPLPKWGDDFLCLSLVS